MNFYFLFLLEFVFINNLKKTGKAIFNVDFTSLVKPTYKILKNKIFTYIIIKRPLMYSCMSSTKFTAHIPTPRNCFKYN